MFDLVLKLIDRCIQLVNERDKQNRSIFVDFVEPLIADFKKVHQDYLNSFSKYRECLSQAENPSQAIEKLSEQLDVDALFSSTGRTDLFSMRILQEDKALSALLDSIYEYLDYAILNRYGYELLPHNNIRYGFKRKILHLSRENFSEDEMRKEALQILDRTVSNLQESYAEVINNAQEAKSKLLMTHKLK